MDIPSAIVWNRSAIKIAYINTEYEGKPYSQLAILNFEKNRQAFFLIMWLSWFTGSSKNEEHSNPIV